MKKILYIYNSDNDKSYLNSDDDIMLYRLNVGSVTGSNVTPINDQEKLNKIATINASLYSEFVYQQNHKFIENNLIYRDELSLYFLTDFSCKRSELFATYSNFCNALFIKSYLDQNKIEKVVFDGCSSDTFESISSVIGDLTIEKKNIINKSSTLGSIFLKNSTFFLKLIITLFFKALFFSNKNIQDSPSVKDLFLTRYPLHLNDKLYEDKYGDLVGTNGTYLVNLFTDGLHQNLSLSGYLQARKKLISEQRVMILDEYLLVKDIVSSFTYSISIMLKLAPLTRTRYLLQGVNLTKSIKNEFYFAMIRLPRLLMWRNPLGRLLKKTKVQRMYYYLHEYSYGRMFTFFFKSFAPNTVTIGFQHGPSSLRKMLYMTAPNELSIKGDGINSFPLPNMVLAEDEFSKTLYLSSGYKNVEVMDRIYRLDYLKKINRSKILKDTSLIAPGLHDGEYLMSTLFNQINNHKNFSYILKAHPRANNKYLKKFENLSNLSIFNGTIEDALSKVDKVYATYSSVAIEAYYLGIDVEIVEIPGKINESPLIDEDFLLNINPLVGD